MANELTVQSKQSLTPHQQNVMGLRRLAESPAYANRFKQVLNDRAPQFLASLVQLVSGSTYLAKCDPNSIMAAAITSAALDLPIDKNLGFAHIVPYKDQAQFQMGAKGFVQLAIRTGQYRFLNYCTVHEGELVSYNELSGEVVLDPNGRKSDTVIGYAAYFKLNNGYEHAEYWTRDKVEKHARRYSKAYGGNYDTPWKTDFDKMALKTVIKSLISHWGIMSIEIQKAVTNDQGVRKDMDTDEVAYPDNSAKAPVMDGPPEDGDLGPQVQVAPAESAKAANAIETAAAENPYPKLQELCKRDGVSEDQVHGFMKAKKLAGEKTVELVQASDASMRTVIGTWSAVLGQIKAIKV